MIEQSGNSLSDTDGSEDARAEEGVATETVVQSVLGARDIRVDPSHIRQLFEGESTHRTLVTFPHPFQRQMVAGGIKRIRRREGIEAALGESPQESVGFQVKRGAFTISLRPSFGLPSDVKTALFIVRDGVGLVGAGEKNNGFGGRVRHHCEFFSRR
jgi:hypothetical protein